MTLIRTRRARLWFSAAVIFAAGFLLAWVRDGLLTAVVLTGAILGALLLSQVLIAWADRGDPR